MATRRKLPSGKYQYIIRITGHTPVSRAFHSIKEGNNWAQVTEDAIRSGTYFLCPSLRMSNLATYATLEPCHFPGIWE